MSKTVDLDLVLTSQIKKGDVNAFKEVYLRHWRNIYTIALSFLKSKQDAEDAVQEIFIKFWQKREYLSDNLSYRPYLFKIAKNSLINISKSFARKVLDEVDFSHLPGMNITDDIIEYNELTRFAYEAIEKLPPKRKIVFNLRSKEGMNNKEIAKEMGISVTMVEKQLKLANNFIRDYLKVNMNVGTVSFLFFINIF